MKKEVILIYLTVPDKRTGKRIIQQLLKKKLVACGNMISPADSFFLWKGKLSSTKEAVVILKTARWKYKQTAGEIKKLHPYECPCILSLPVKDGFKPFLDWISESTSC